MKNISKFISPCIVILLMLSAGCGFGTNISKMDSSTISISKDGTVDNLIVEDFDEGLYNIDELKEMTDQEVSSYNQANGDDAVLVKDIKLDNGKVRMEMTFKTAEDYAGFTYEKLTYGAVSSAKLSGQSIVNLVDADGNAVSPEVIDELSEEHIIVTTNKDKMVLPYKVKYVSTGVVIEKNNIVDLSQVGEDGEALIILSK
ncbi:MAG: hypothetical protein K6G06_09210 [Butyrivibrio sp.]|nr:hypothetical protein [Butyrivibrio sp.]